MRYLMPLAAAAAILGGATSASALTYAVSITPEGQSTVSTPTATDVRSDAGNALGARDGKFFSLGLGKYADFTFGQDFTGAGAVYEVTYGAVVGWPEFIDILVYNSPDDSGAVVIASAVRNTLAQTGATFSFSGTWDTLRILDVTARECGLDNTLNCTQSADSSGADGFDVDAVGVSVVPLPAAAWLLLGVSGGLFAAKRRQSRKTA